jgi:hypothetical protein
MSLLQHAKDELDQIGMTADGDEYNAMMRNHILHMVEEFSKEGHSGFSANYAINCLQKLLRFEPLSPLTGEDSEWESVRHLGDDPHYQNKRCSRVFKDKDGICHDVEGYIYYNWVTDEDGNKYKSCFTGGGKPCKVVTFPYTPTTEYVEDTETNV